MLKVKVELNITGVTEVTANCRNVDSAAFERH